MKNNEMGKECWRPQLVDTGDVVLTESLMPLIEALAENVHDTWAKRRMDDGWTYGPVRDDAKKQHPSLVPYCQLSESEKAYDRATAISTLKFICKMGYGIERAKEAE